MIFFDIGAHIGSYFALHDARSRLREYIIFIVWREPIFAFEFDQALFEFA